MVRRHAGKLAAIAIAVLVASVVWRARRRAGAVASSAVTDDLPATAAPTDDVIATADEPVVAATTEIEPVEIDATDTMPDDAASDDADEPAAAARVFMAADAPPVQNDDDDTDVDDPPDEPVAVAPEPEPEPEPLLDLTQIERDLAGVEAALRRLDEGTYWTDEVTGEPIDELVLAADPVARRNP